jgi:hypothetical protein
MERGGERGKEWGNRKERWRKGQGKGESERQWKRKVGGVGEEKMKREEKRRRERNE